MAQNRHPFWIKYIGIYSITRAIKELPSFHKEGWLYWLLLLQKLLLCCDTDKRIGLDTDIMEVKKNWLQMINTNEIERSSIIIMQFNLPFIKITNE